MLKISTDQMLCLELKPVCSNCKDGIIWDWTDKYLSLHYNTPFQRWSPVYLPNVANRCFVSDILISNLSRATSYLALCDAYHFLIIILFRIMFVGMKYWSCCRIMSMSVLLSNFFIQPQQIATNKQHSQMSHTLSLATQIKKKKLF